MIAMIYILHRDGLGRQTRVCSGPGSADRPGCWWGSTNSALGCQPCVSDPIFFSSDSCSVPSSTLLARRDNDLTRQYYNNSQDKRAPKSQRRASAYLLSPDL